MLLSAPISPVSRRASRGTVSLVALCFVAVLGISLASYIAICSRAMTLSNRSFQASLSKQLAEAGIEEALRAFNKNDWSDWTNNGYSADWTLDTTNKRATATLTIPASSFGQGTTATVKIRVDNYDAAHQGSTWSNAKTYRINDLVGYNGVWYRSVRNNNLNHTPGNLTWWAEEPISWMWSNNITYARYDLANYKGIWFRCIAFSSTANTPTLPVPTSGTVYWVPIPSLRKWTASTAYAQHDVVVYEDTSTGDYSLHRCLTAHTSGSDFSSQSSNWSTDVRALPLAWNSGTIYTRGAMLNYKGVWYYCRQSGTSSTAPDSDSSMWSPVLNSDGTAGDPDENTYSSGTTYFTGDYVYRESDNSWYRCISSHTYSSGDINDTTKWDDSGNDRLPYISWAWRTVASSSYSFDDAVFYGTSSSSGAWYRCINTLSSPGSTSLPVGGSSSSSYWQNALTGSKHAWNSGYNYNLGDVVYHSSTNSWYRCIKAHTAQAPSSTSLYWANTPLQPNDWSPNRQYSQYDIVRYNGLWYLSLQNNNYKQSPVAASSIYWAVAPLTLSAWDATREYSLGELVSKADVWYRCIAPHKNQAPPNASYWSVQTGYGGSYAWAAATGYTAGTYRSYGGSWYQCLITNTGESPNNSTYWNALSAPAVYTEATVTIANSPSLKTQLRTNIAPSPLFPNAAGATNTLTITGGTGVVDSYDGSAYAISDSGGNSTYTYGQTSSPFSASPGWNKGYTATLAAGSELTSGTSSALTVGNGTTVWGYAAAPSSSDSPYAPRFSYGSSASIKGASSAASPNVDTSRVSRTSYVPKFDTRPSGDLQTTWSTVPLGLQLASPSTINLGVPGATTPSRYYVSGTWLQLGSSESTQTININGPVILHIYGSLRMRGGSTININSTGSAEIHVGKQLLFESGTNGIVNKSPDSTNPDPKKLILIVHSATSDVQIYRYVSSFHGVLYAPYTTTSSGLVIDNGMSVYGAISASKITFDDQANLHYDTSLRYATFGGVDQPYAVSEWRELPLTEQATLP